MALTERKIIKQVSVLPEVGAIQVQWANQVLREGEVISEQYERRAYNVEQKNLFLTDVPDGAPYVAALGW